MIVSGTKQLAATRDVVWSVINEPSEMAKLMPGVESFEIQDEKHWTAKVKVPLGLGGLKMTMKFEKLEEREPEFASMRAKGQGVGALMDMTTSFTLTEADGGTSMAWEADVKIAGPVGAMGQRVLQPIVNQQVSQVLVALEQRVTETASREQDARWSPNGKWIAFVSFGTDVPLGDHPPNKDVSIRIMPADGSAPPRVLTTLFGGQGTMNVPSWSPDSKSIAFVSYRLVR